MGYTVSSKIAQYVGWALIVLYTLGFLFWLGVGIYVAVDKPSNLEHVLFSTINIYSLIPLVLFVLRLFASGDDWWENGVPSFVYVLGFWVLAAAGALSSLFVMLRSILDSQFNKSRDENLLIALDATLLAISVISFLYQFVCGVYVLLIRRPSFMREDKRGQSTTTSQPVRSTFSTRSRQFRSAGY